MNYFRILPNGFIKVFEGNKIYTIFKSSEQVDSLKSLGFIEVNGKDIYLGSFKDALEGAKVYDRYVIENNLEHTINNVLEI